MLARIGEDEMLIVETTSFAGIPYADHFIVITRWAVLVDYHSESGAQGPGIEIQVSHVALGL